MARLDLPQADIALFTDAANTRVEIPFLTAVSPQVQPAVALVRFEGERYPRAFRGEGLTRTLSLTMLYPSDYHKDALALAKLLEYAHTTAPDGRLQIRTNAGRVGGLDPLEVVIVTAWSDTPQVGLFRSFSVEATRVHFSVEV